MQLITVNCSLALGRALHCGRVPPHVLLIPVAGSPQEFRVTLFSPTLLTKGAIINIKQMNFILYNVGTLPIFHQTYHYWGVLSLLCYHCDIWEPMLNRSPISFSSICAIASPHALIKSWLLFLPLSHSTHIHENRKQTCLYYGPTSHAQKALLQSRKGITEMQKCLSRVRTELGRILV